MVRNRGVLLCSLLVGISSVFSVMCSGRVGAKQKASLSSTREIVTHRTIFFRVTNIRIR